MDKELIAYRFSKSLKSYNEEALAQKQIVEKLFSLLQTHVKLDFDSILEFGTGTGLLTEFICKHANYNKLYLNDLSNEFKQFVFKELPQISNTKTTFLSGDIEKVEIPETLDLIISSSTEQWIENTNAFYSKMGNSLSENGYFVFSTFGPDNLQQLRKATGQTLDYKSMSQTQDLLSNNFEIIHSEEEKIALNFESALDILAHIKKTGVNAISRQNWNKKSVQQIISNIEDVCKTEQGFQITYHPIYFILRKRETAN
jgi:malonyl-CoA O-methyltransferase